MEDLSALEPEREATPSPVTIENVPLKMLNVALAEPGPGYQRAPLSRIVNKIAANFDWDMFDPIIVSIRKDGPRAGELFIVDGQHRYLAASKLFPETQEIPAMLVSMTFEQEAMRFARQGENRRSVNSRDLFRAKIEARDPVALDIRRIVEDAGFRMNMNSGPGAGEISAVHAVNSIYTRMSPEILKIVLHIVNSAYPKTTTSRSDARLLMGIAHFLYYFPVAKVDRLIEKLSAPEAHPKRLIQASAMYSTSSGNGSRGNPSVSRAILDQYNKNTSSNRLDWDLNKYREAAIKRK